MRIRCPLCGAKTKNLGFINGGFGYYGKNYGKIACFDCIHKLKKGKTIKWIGEPTRNELKLQEILLKHGIKIIPHVMRLYPSYWQKASGAWVWHVYEKGSIIDIGSSHRLLEVLKAKDLRFINAHHSVDIVIND